MESTFENPVRLPRLLRLLRVIPFPRKLGILERIFGRTLSSLGVVWVSTHLGPCWKLDLRDVSHRWIVYGTYEGPRQMKWIRSWLSSGGRVVDSGANVGEMTLYFSALPGVEVLCVEPVAENRSWLAECLRSNRITCARVADVGLGATEAFSDIQVCNGRSTLKAEWYASQTLAKSRVRLTTLESLLKSEGIQRVRLWKLDVEGWELPALEGAAELLENRKIDAVLIEVTPERFPDLRDFLAKYEYRLHEIGDHGLIPVEHARQHGNLVAIPTSGVGGAY